MTFSLFKIFISNLYSFSEFFENFKKGIKGIMKNILFILLAIYLVGIMAFLYVLITKNTYNTLSYLDQTSLFPGIAMLLSIIVVFNFGILSVATQYYAGNGEEQFLCLPLTAKEFFTAKFLTSFVTDAIIGIVLFAISSGYYGYREGLLTSPLFYIGSIVASFCISITVIALIYLLLILVLYFIPSFRKRSLLNGIASFFVFVMAFGIGMASSLTTTVAMEDVKEVGSMMNGASSSLLLISEKYKIFGFLGDALKGKIIPILIMLFVIAFILFVFIPIMSKLYIKTFEGASDIKTKRLSKEKIDKVVKSETKKNSIFKTMLYRDIKGVWREPTFFANGPLFVFLFPLIMVVAFFLPALMHGGIAEVRDFVQSMTESFFSMESERSRIIYFLAFGLTAFTMFSGDLTMVASTSFSREGKGFQTIKALPITHEIIIKVKLVHSYLYSFISCVITTFIFVLMVLLLALPLTLKEVVTIILVMWYVVLASSALILIIDMLFDTINPKLNWDTPQAAMKQNLNTLFGMLVNMVAVIIFIILGVLGGVIENPSLLILIALGTLSLIIALPVGHAYFKYADKKISIM